MSDKCLLYKTDKLRYLDKLRLSESAEASATNVLSHLRQSTEFVTLSTRLPTIVKQQSSLKTLYLFRYIVWQIVYYEPELH